MRAILAPLRYHAGMGFASVLLDVLLLVVAVATLHVASRAGAYLTDRFFPNPEARRRRGLCAACGYNLRGNLSGVCPECGTPTTPPLRQQ